MADALRLDQQRNQRATVLRVYNYYRVLIAFLFLFLFTNADASQFIGSLYPDVFRITSLTYLSINILIVVASFWVPPRLMIRPPVTFAIVVFDIICITLIMAASGGVASGLGNFLILSCAFGGSLILGRVSAVLPAIAFILTAYNEFYLYFRGVIEMQNFFQAGILGVVFFAANIFFQAAARQLQRTETAVLTLEQMNQLIIDTLKTGVVVVADNGDIKSINRAGEAFLNLQSTKENPQRTLPTHLMEKLNDWQHNAGLAVAAFNTQDSSPELIASFSHLGAPAADSVIFIEDSAGLQQQAQQLKLASLGRLSASIAHEIRNPLGAISHAAQLLGESQNLNKGDQRLSEIIHGHCLRMNDVIENVLLMSRRRAPSQQQLKLANWLEGFLEDFRAGQPGSPQITVDIQPADITLSVDPVHLSQILGNLCQNGLRYSEQHTGEAHLTLRGRCDPDTQNPYLEVIDVGTGIDPSLVENLFEPFFTTETTGTGLGLYLSRELCAANNARLGYSPASGGGSCFRISFLDQARQ